MRNVFIYGIFLLLLIAGGALAQSTDETVESSNKRYADIAEKARLCETDNDQGEFGELVMNTLTINSRSHQWRAVGKYELTFKFFYKDGDDGIRMYPDQLVLVKVERKFSNRVHLEEYLYSAKGSLLYYSLKAEPASPDAAETKIYFSGLKAIRILEDGKTRNVRIQKYSMSTQDVLEQSREIKDTFNKSIKL